MSGPVQARFADGRLHLQHGPIDLVIEAFGEHEEVEAAYRQAWERFQDILQTLVEELAVLRAPVGDAYPPVRGPVATRMVAAVWPHRDVFITPMAAVAGALVDHPWVNSQIAAGELALLPQINVGLAIALDGGLVVPVVHDTNELSLAALSVETARLVALARSGKLSLSDLEGGTFSVTALGMFGVDAFTPVINPPNTAILGVGRIRDAVAWADGLPIRTKLMTLSFTWDHRAFDGVPAAEFTATVRDRLENWPPER